jgi:hypothetical protein
MFPKVIVSLFLAGISGILSAQSVPAPANSNQFNLKFHPPDQHPTDVAARPTSLAQAVDRVEASAPDDNGVETPGPLSATVNLVDLALPLDSSPDVAHARDAVAAADAKVATLCIDIWSAMCFGAKADLYDRQADHLSEEKAVANDRRLRARMAWMRLENVLKTGVDDKAVSGQLQVLMDECGKERACNDIKKALYTQLNQPRTQRAVVMEEGRKNVLFLKQLEENYHLVIVNHDAQLVLAYRDRAEFSHLATVRSAYEGVMAKQAPAKPDKGAQYYTLPAK